jgi:2-C-methyl-D-erythritol 4-phosphate cytidylyltransferase
MVTAIILAGGIGSRVGADVPKQFITILGKPIIVYTIEIYQKCEEVDNIEVVCHHSYLQFLSNLVEEYRLTKVKWICNGGETFQDSVISGIDFLKDKISFDDTIMIHYGAAPFTSLKILKSALKVCNEKGNAVSAIPCFQLMGTNNNGICSNEWVNRDDYVQITCPYCFNYGFVVSLYEKARSENLLDKVEPHTTTLMQYMGYKLYLSYGDQTNIKITTKEDLLLFQGFVLVNNNQSGL